MPTTTPITSKESTPSATSTTMLSTTTEVATSTTYTSCNQPLLPISCSANGPNEPYDISLGEEKIVSGYKIASNQAAYLQKFHIAFKLESKDKFDIFMNPRNKLPLYLQGISEK